ncbi:12673_t:CDS:2, partial [Racocetra fulgida]
VSVSANSELSGSTNELSGPTNESSSPTNKFYGFTNKSPSSMNKLPDSTNKLPSSLSDLVDKELSGLVNKKLSVLENKKLSSLENLEVNSNLSGSMNFKVDSNRSGLINFEIDSNCSDFGFASNLPSEDSMSDNDVNINENQINNIEDSFNNWSAVQYAVDAYAKQEGFVAIKYHKDLDPTDRFIIHRRDYACWKFGKNKSKKVENIDKHHGVFGKTELALKHLQFLQAILNKIENYTTVGQL